MPPQRHPELPDTPLAHELDDIARGTSIQPNALYPFEHLLASWQVRLLAGPGKESAVYAEVASACLLAAAAAIHDDTDRHIARAVLCIGKYDGMPVKARQQHLHASEAKGESGLTTWMYKKRRNPILVHVHGYLTAGEPQPAVNETLAQNTIELAYTGFRIDWLASMSEAHTSNALPYGDAQMIAVRQVRAHYSLLAFARLVQSMNAPIVAAEPPRFERPADSGISDSVASETCCTS